MRILIIEDDRDAADSLVNGLEAKGFVVDIAYDGVRGFAAAQTGGYDALIVDRMLPGLDGLSLVRQLRDKDNQTPAIMLTALDSVDDKVEGFEAGADDYLAKPFAFAELLARLRALAKRSSSTGGATKITIGDLCLDKISREVRRQDKKIHLKPREFELLLYFSQHIDEPVSRTMLLKDVWGLDFDPQTNIVDVHVSRLRKKIDKDFREPLISTIRGVGYVFGPKHLL